MASITYDGQSFMIDGRRIFLAAGTIEYARCPRELWSERLRQAKHAGLNAITTSVVWSRHEARPGQFDFTGENDLRHFLTLVKAAGLLAILRVGPYVGQGFDLGGLPPWILSQNNVALRTANSVFLESCSRFFGALAKQVRDLQRTAVGPDGRDTGGPIILIQSESHWTCGHQTLANGYLGELNRYLRESGFEVPAINANNLWQGVEGEIDCWSGSGGLLANLRQLAVVRGSQPRLVAEYRPGERTFWGGPASRALDAAALQRGLAEILAAGGQFNLEPFAAGLNMGFNAGRLAHDVAAFATTRDDAGAPLSDTGKPRPTFDALRRITLFASRFGRLLSHLDPKRPVVSLAPNIAQPPVGGKASKSTKPTGHVVLHAAGSQGSVVFIFAPAAAPDAPAPTEPVHLLLPDGATLPVYLGTQSVTWIVLESRLVGRSQLDYCNLAPIAMAGRVLVLAGPAGTPALLSINGADLEATVPEADDEPVLIDHEGVMLMIIADAALPTVFVGDDAVYLGVDGLTLTGEPIVPAWGAAFHRINGDSLDTKILADAHPKRPVDRSPVKAAAVPAPRGRAAKNRKGRAEPAVPTELPPLGPNAVVIPHRKVPTRITLSAWTTAPLSDYCDGTCPRYASTNGPADLNVMGAPFGYGWYRLKLKSSSARKILVAAPHGGDRLALFLGGEATGLLGVGPGATHDTTLKLAKGEQTLVVLAENFGRFSAGTNLAEGKGLLGHLWEVQPARVAKPALQRGNPVDVLAFRAPLWDLHPGDVTDPQRLTWTLPHHRREGVLLRLNPKGYRGLLLVNDKPERYFDASGPATIFFEESALLRGNNVFQLAILGSMEDAQRDLAGSLEIFECLEAVTAKAEWSFAKWERPATSAFGAELKRVTTGPRWHRATFKGPEHATDLHLDAAGLSKGQLYLNGRHLGRYFTATDAGKAVGPQTDLWLPSPYIQSGRENEILLFDEHGFAPSKVRVYVD